MGDLMSAALQNRLEQLRVMPVLAIENPDLGIKVAEVLTDAGFPAAEVTFRTDSAARVMAGIRQAFPDMLLGAGTVTSKEQLVAAQEAGVDFAVSPGFNPAIVGLAGQLGLPFIPGINSPSQVEQAMMMGLQVLKFFPAEVSGGVSMLKALQSVYPVRFMPTGGVSTDNVRQYLELDSVLVCGGTWLAPAELIEQQKWQLIAHRLSELRRLLV